MLWGGRFKEKLDSEAMEFSSSLVFDYNLLEEDIEVSIAHAEMLSEIGILSKAELKKIIYGLEKILEEASGNKWKPSPTIYEDIHSAIEDRLYELIGNTAGKLHTGRSRNDQIVTVFKLWIQKAIYDLEEKIKQLQNSLLKLSENNENTIMPGFTHLQRAQPVSLAFHLLAYIEMFERDKKRLSNVRSETDESPLGSGALAGSTLPLDRDYTSKKLGFVRFSKNSLDAVSDRDFVIDFLNACNIGMMHLSRLSEELILWASSEWNFITIDDKYSTGSSLMPQKKNPDMLELIRGKSGRVFGNYSSVLVMMKGLPLSYNRDMQEDKEPVFDSYLQFAKSLGIASKIINSIKINKNRFIEELDGDFILATDLAEWLVLKGIPFRESHKIVGKVVKFAEDKNKKLNELQLDDLLNIHPVFEKSALDILKIKNALYRKVTQGSPNPDLVREQINKWKELIKVN